MFTAESCRSMYNHSMSRIIPPSIIINMLRIKLVKGFSISYEFSTQMNEKYGSDLIFRCDKDGRLSCNNKEESIETVLDADEFVLILAELRKMCGDVTGNFSYSAFFTSGDVTGISYIFKDKIIDYKLTVDTENYSEDNMGDIVDKTITLFEDLELK